LRVALEVDGVEPTGVHRDAVAQFQEPGRSCAVGYHEKYGFAGAVLVLLQVHRLRVDLRLK